MGGASHRIGKRKARGARGPGGAVLAGVLAASLAWPAQAQTAPSPPASRAQAYALGVMCTALFENFKKRTPPGVPQAAAYQQALATWAYYVQAINPDEAVFRPAFAEQNRAIEEEIARVEGRLERSEQLVQKFTDCNRTPPPVPGGSPPAAEPDWPAGAKAYETARTTSTPFPDTDRENVVRCHNYWWAWARALDAGIIPDAAIKALGPTFTRENVRGNLLPVWGGLQGGVTMSMPDEAAADALLDWGLAEGKVADKLIAAAVQGQPAEMRGYFTQLGKCQAE